MTVYNHDHAEAYKKLAADIKKAILDHPTERDDVKQILDDSMRFLKKNKEGIMNDKKAEKVMTEGEYIVDTFSDPNSRQLAIYVLLAIINYLEVTGNMDIR